MFKFSIIMRLCLVGFISALFQCSEVHSAHVIKISSDVDFSGISQDITLGNTCFNLRHPINDNISSMDPNGKCVRLYIDERCRGPFVEVQESISDLGSLNINDAVSSIKLCNEMSFRSRMDKKLNKILHDFDYEEEE